MPFKAYFQEPLTSEAFSGLRFGVIVWHLGWSAFMLTSLLALLFMPASGFVIAALVAITVPGACAVILLQQDTSVLRKSLVWVWGICALLAVGLTGGIAGPLAAFIGLPLVAAVALNQRVLISLGATISFMLALFATLISLWGGIVMPDTQESFWLSVIAIFSVVGGLGLSLLPALRVRVERAADAEEARERLLKMLAEQPYLIVCFNESGQMVSAYGEAPAGLDMKALMLSGLVASAHVPDRTAVRTALDTALQDGRADVGFTPHAAMDHYVLLSLRRSDDNRLYGVMSDASLQHAREAALDSARTEAEYLNQGKTQFLASMSHELRTPLNAVIGFSDIMRQQLFGELSPKYTEYAQLIWESGQHVLDMINDVLDMSKIEAQRYELTLETFDIREPVSQALRLIRGTAHDKAIDILSHMPPQAITVTADKRAIKQISLNLLSNAVKFTPRGGDVSLALEAVENHVIITVSDTGIGIAPDDLNRIGLPYEQSGSAEQRAMGTGLGLSIVKAMAHLHGGTLSLNSHLGEGTRVTVSLPVRQVNGEEEVELPFTDAPLVRAEEASAGGRGQSLDAFTKSALNPLQDINHTPEAVSSFGAFVIRPPKS